MLQIEEQPHGTNEVNFFKDLNISGLKASPCIIKIEGELSLTRTETGTDYVLEYFYNSDKRSNLQNLIMET